MISLKATLIATVAILGLLILLLIRELVDLLLARVPASQKTVHTGKPDQTPSTNNPHFIPRVIWSYWHTTPTPEFIAKCQVNWRRFAPDHELRLIHKNTITEWLGKGEILGEFSQLPPFRQADWLRLKLLAEYGGIWIDASTLLTQNLDWVHQLRVKNNSEYVGFYIDRFTTRPDKPIVENWFMAAVPQSAFIIALAREFDQAIELGESAYLEKLNKTGRLNEIVQGLNHADQLYLIMHVAAAVILDKSEKDFRLSLIKAEDSALGFHAALKWRKRHLFARLALTPCPDQLPCIIKLRGGDRRIFEQGLARGWICKGSALTRLLSPTEQTAK